jgi:hypothetical protein
LTLDWLEFILIVMGLMTNHEYIISLFERIAHNSTMDKLTSTEQKWLDNSISLRESMTNDELMIWYQEIYKG